MCVTQQLEAATRYYIATRLVYSHTTPPPPSRLHLLTTAATDADAHKSVHERYLQTSTSTMCSLIKHTLRQISAKLSIFKGHRAGVATTHLVKQLDKIRIQNQ